MRPDRQSKHRSCFKLHIFLCLYNQEISLNFPFKLFLNRKVRCHGECQRISIGVIQIGAQVHRIEQDLLGTHIQCIDVLSRHGLIIGTCNFCRNSKFSRSTLRIRSNQNNLSIATGVRDRCNQQASATDYRSKQAIVASYLKGQCRRLSGIIRKPALHFGLGVFLRAFKVFGKVSKTVTHRISNTFHNYRSHVLVHNGEGYHHRFRGITFSIDNVIHEGIFAFIVASFVSKRTVLGNSDLTFNGIVIQISLQSRLAIRILVVCKQALLRINLIHRILNYLVGIFLSNRRISHRENLHIEVNASSILIVDSKQGHLGNTICIGNRRKFHHMVGLYRTILGLQNSARLHLNFKTCFSRIRIAEHEAFQRNLNQGCSKVFAQHQGVTQSIAACVAQGQDRIIQNNLNRVIHIGHLDRHLGFFAGLHFVIRVCASGIFRQHVSKEVNTIEIFFRSIGKHSRFPIKGQGTMGRFSHHRCRIGITIRIVVVTHHVIAQSHLESRFFLSFIGIVDSNRCVLTILCRECQLIANRFLCIIRSRNSDHSIAFRIGSSNQVNHTCFVIERISQLHKARLITNNLDGV